MLRGLVLDLWDRSRRGWGFASDHLAALFRQERDLSGPEKAWISQTLYGMIRQARRLEHALSDSSPSGNARLVAWRLLEGEIGVDAAARELPGIDWGSVLGVDVRVAVEADPVKRLALGRSLPDWLAARLLAEYPEDADALAAALNVRPPVTVRANALKTTRDELAATLGREGIASRPTPWARFGLELTTPCAPYELKAFQAGLFEVQDEGSQLVADLVAPPPGGLVVDACAGAGGKTLALGALLGGRGRIVAAEPSEARMAELRRRARRAGLTNIQPIELPGGEWPEALTRLAGTADRVLVDAPCSGIGALRRNPEARWRLTEEDVARLVGVQAGILDRAAELVAPGGRLVYATCTVLEAENEGAVSRFREAHPDFQPMRAVEIWGGELGRPVTDPTGTVLRLLPHRHGTDGFFAAVLRRAPTKNAGSPGEEIV